MFTNHTQQKQTQRGIKEKTDHELLLASADGDHAAFDEIVFRYKKPIINYLTRMLGDYERALELSQETFLRVYVNAERYQMISTFSSWIYKIATNLALNDLRRRKRVRFLPMVFWGNSDSDEEKERDIEDVSAIMPDKAVQNLQLQKIIAREIERLPLRYKTPLVLRDIQEQSYEEIAKITELPLGTVKSRINRGRLILRKKLKPYL